MNKIIIACAFVLAACGSSQKAPTTNQSTGNQSGTSTTAAEPGQDGMAPPTGDGQPCTQEIAMVCPDGQVDACLKSPPEGDTHKCVAQ